MSQGYEMTHDNDDLVIRIPIGPSAIAAAVASSTGKSKLVASTRGYIPVGPAALGAKLNLSLIIPNR